MPRTLALVSASLVVFVISFMFTTAMIERGFAGALLAIYRFVNP